MHKNTPDATGPVEENPTAITSQANAAQTKSALEPDAKHDDPDNLREGIVRYEGTISKINKDGDTVLSDHIGPGEKRTGED
jgi:hypothetical protein